MKKNLTAGNIIPIIIIAYVLALAVRFETGAPFEGFCLAFGYFLALVSLVAYIGHGMKL